MIAASFSQAAEDYRRVEQAICYLTENFQQQPDLTTIAAQIDLSEYHFQRLFRRWAGISPKRFLQFLTLEYAKSRLVESSSLLETAYEAGLSGPGRLHDLFVTYEAITPGAYKQAGAGLEIHYGFHPSPFGRCLLAITERGLCGLAFVQDDRPHDTLIEMQANWPQARWQEDPGQTAALAAHIFDRNGGSSDPLKLLLRGTPFQLKVWQALLRIPAGALVSYGAVAAAIGRPGAARAVGGAAARNPIGYLIPCHRVIRRAGLVDGYHWGTARKKAIIAWEAAQTGA